MNINVLLNGSYQIIFFRNTLYRIGIFIISSLLLCGCEPQPNRYVLKKDAAPLLKIDVRHIPDAIPKEEPLSRYGNSATYTVLGKKYTTLKTAHGYRERGIASWYGMKFHAYLTSNREAYNLFKMTAAHRSLPIPTYVRVTNLNNGKKVIVRVNDRGPFVPNRIIDLSYVAAKKLDMLTTGTAPVEVEAIIPKKRFTLSYLIPPSAQKSSPTKVKKKIWLQTGSFRVQSNAQQSATYIRRLTGKATKLETFKKTNSSVSLYRVIVGPFENIEQTRPIQESLKNKGFKNILIKHL